MPVTLETEGAAEGAKQERGYLVKETPEKPGNGIQKTREGEEGSGARHFKRLQVGHRLGQVQSWGPQLRFPENWGRARGLRKDRDGRDPERGGWAALILS